VAGEVPSVARHLLNKAGGLGISKRCRLSGGSVCQLQPCNLQYRAVLYIAASLKQSLLCHPPLVRDCSHFADGCQHQTVVLFPSCKQRKHTALFNYLQARISIRTVVHVFSMQERRVPDSCHTITPRRCVDDVFHTGPPLHAFCFSLTTENPRPLLVIWGRLLFVTSPRKPTGITTKSKSRQ